ncbi:hypothetical protein BDY19DRAFT_989307 [Irpex rosettiformis]|uniref:Uncharacterized protein n=1 Tax=Irpex rosettiformis TaxID=378272 RepID=A0ACB8UHD5_9APHY|nr:hypothetical protein BDY19DRAFT_989307 [Irpex rosettiformis]
MSRSNGRLEPEVIFADGMAYSKGKLEEAFGPGGILDKPVKQPRETFAGKRDDVDLIVHELEISRVQAEKALADHNGDVVKTLVALVS